jgi:hypothetical protein
MFADRFETMSGRLICIFDRVFMHHPKTTISENASRNALFHKTFFGFCASYVLKMQLRSHWANILGNPSALTGRVAHYTGRKVS